MCNDENSHPGYLVSWWSNFPSIFVTLATNAWGKMMLLLVKSKVTMCRTETLCRLLHKIKSLHFSAWNVPYPPRLCCSQFSLHIFLMISLIIIHNTPHLYLNLLPLKKILLLETVFIWLDFAHLSDKERKKQKETHYVYSSLAHWTLTITCRSGITDF